MTDVHVVLVETSGNQAFIFATNKLRQQIGASELVYRAGTEFVLDAVAAVSGRPTLFNNDPKQLRATLVDRKRNPQIATQDQNGVEIITATSGKALLLTKSDNVARSIVDQATRRALREAPGLDLCGAVSRAFNWANDDVHQAIDDVHRVFDEVRSLRPGPEWRFPSVPFAARCRFSEFPASRFVPEGDGMMEASRVAAAKHRECNAGFDRLQTMAGGMPFPADAGQLEKLVEGLRWHAVIHADGNGIGAIFQNFRVRSQTRDNPEYVCKLRNFSLDLEAASCAAFIRAAGPLARQSNELVPIIPLILGGDDLTLMCTGEAALPLAKRYLQSFESETKKAPGVRALSADGLAACAGVAVIKPHFPFHAAYDLAEQLLQSAKQVKVQAPGQSASAMDFHILFDSTFSDLDTIRAKRLTADNQQTRLTAKPYVVSENPQGPWAQAHRLELLEDRIRAINEQSEDDRPMIPTSQLHELREGLFLGHQIADARLDLIRHRYPALSALAESNGSLFRQTNGGRETLMLDALDAAPFWQE